MTLDTLRFPKATRFLISGGGGFIGYHLVETLLRKNHYVTVLDNFSTGKKERLSSFLDHERFQLIEGDLLDFSCCLAATTGIDYVLHQAALGSVPRSMHAPQLYHENNVTGMLNLLEASVHNQVKRFIYASSSSVYGDHPALPKVEDCVGMPLSPYALTKKTNELYGKLYHSVYQLETIGLRYFNVFGEYQDPTHTYAAVIPKFITLLLEGKTPIIYGDGTISRDFTYVKNIVKANLLACLAPSHATGEVYNIGCGGSITLKKLYTTLAELLALDKEVLYGPHRLGDILHSHACIKKAQDFLGYTPDYTFEEGLAITLDWYQKNNLF